MIILDEKPFKKVTHSGGKFFSLIFINTECPTYYNGVIVTVC